MWPSSARLLKARGDVDVRDTSGIDTLAALLRGEMGVAAGDVASATVEGRALFAAAKTERVLAPAFRSMIDTGGVESIPDDVRREIRRTLVLASGEAALRYAELTEVLHALQAAGVGAVLLKGAALAHTVYAHPEDRWATDVDLLIADDRRTAAMHVFEGLGYTMPWGVRGEWTSHQFFYSRSMKAGLTSAIDVHWRISNRHRYAGVLTYAALRARSQPVPALGEAARAISLPDALLHAAIHRVGHHRDLHQPLLWLYDVHLLATAMTSDQIATCARRAETCGVLDELRDITLDSARHFPSARIDELIAALPGRRGLRLHVPAGVLPDAVDDLLHIRGVRGRAAFVAEKLNPPPAPDGDGDAAGPVHEARRIVGALRREARKMVARRKGRR